MTELVVACSLMVTATGLVATSAVGSQRLQRVEHQNRVASDELSNHLERLTLLRGDELELALNSLEVSDWAASLLRGVVLSSNLIDDEYGKRIELTMQWNRRGPAAPLKAVRWLDNRNARTGGDGA